MEPARRPGSLPERILATLLTPFVALWDVTGRGVMAFFAALERLDPVTAIVSLGRRFAPWARRQWERVLPTLVRIREFLVRTRQRLADFLHPLTRRIGAAIDVVGRVLQRLFGPVVAAVRNAAAAARRGVEPAVTTARRWWSTATEPVRRVRRAVRRRYRRTLAWVRRRVLRLGRQPRNPDPQNPQGV